MTITDKDGFAFLPKRCDKCNRLFWFEPYWVYYKEVGIAADEPLRIAKHLPKKDKVLPLVQIGWDEDLCGLEAKYMDMLSPTYTDGQMRDGGLSF